MNYHPDYQARILHRAIRRAQQRQQMAEWMLIAVIFSAGLLCGWAITVVSLIK